MNNYDISVVLGSKNRKNLLKATIRSIRENGFEGRMEIIVVDGGSNDGTCDWLAKQKDILTIIQPNFRIIDQQGISILSHSWGEFINIGFKYSSSPWVVMVSDDLILTEGALQKGYYLLNERVKNGEKIGGGAFFFREYPRQDFYRVGMLPGNVININHGFYNKEALKDVNFIDENSFNFYCADGDLILRMHNKGWKIIALKGCYAEHLTHKPGIRRKAYSPATLRDIEVFNKRYPHSCDHECQMEYIKVSNGRRFFWKVAFINCFLGVLLKFADRLNHVKLLLRR